jgi:lipoprotein-anchoring transpeptidase ErfK/SrfK
MSSQFSFIKTILASALVLVVLALPGRAEFDIDKQIEGINQEVGKQLNGLGAFFEKFGENLNEGVKSVTPDDRKKATSKPTDFSKITTGSTRNVVEIDANYAPGSVIVRTSTRKLYYVLSPGRALQYGVGVGREGFQWGGESHISRKKEWPDWRPPKEMIERERVKNNREIPEFMPGGPENPLGARALYLGATLYRIHGTNQAQTIGGAVSSGCIRMRNADVIDLYERVAVGSKVYVYH